MVSAGCWFDNTFDGRTGDYGIVCVYTRMCIDFLVCNEICDQNECVLSGPGTSRILLTIDCIYGVDVCDRGGVTKAIPVCDRKGGRFWGGILCALSHSVGVQAESALYAYHTHTHTYQKCQ